MNDVTAIYRAYLLRLWRTPGAGWRASLEEPGTGSRRAFATLALLMDFLEQRSGSVATRELPPDKAGEGDGPNGKSNPLPDVVLNPSIGPLKPVDRSGF